MKLIIVLEYRFEGTPDGAVWTSMTYPCAYWGRYLSVFDSVTVLARVRRVSEVAPGARRVDGDRVRVHPIPFYQGPLQYLLNVRATQAAIRSALRVRSAVILRVPGVIGALAARHLARQGRPFGLEVVGDPWDVFAAGANRHPLRPMFRWWFTRELRWLCREAANVLYVTEWTLQRRYPANPGRSRHAEASLQTGAFGVSDVDMSDQAFVASNVEMSDGAFATHLAARPASPASRLRLLSVGSMDQPYKGHETLINAVARCRHQGLDLELVLVGDGRMRAAFEEQVRKLGLGDRVHFLGQLPAGEAIQEQLDRANLFVLPSLVEGMPRALIEAMGRSLPCLGSRVGGIPELLADEALVTPGDARQLADRIAVLAEDAALRSRLGLQNWTVAQRFHERTLQPKREAFYRSVKRSAEAALVGHPGGSP